MWVVLHCCTDKSSYLGICSGIFLIHCMENASLYWLETINYVRDSTIENHI